MTGELFPRLPKALAGFQQCLAGNAPDAQARSTQRPHLLDAGNVESQLSGPDGRDISAGPGSNNHQIVLSHRCHKLSVSQTYMNRPCRQQVVQQVRTFRPFEEPSRLRKESMPDWTQGKG